MHENESAFLAMIRHSEGTDMAKNPWAVCYGYKHVIQNFWDHPAVTGEWRGEPLESLGPQYAHLWSTAAGAYQITKGTWVALRDRLKLPNFKPPAQDLAALELIRERGAEQLVIEGDIAGAVNRLHEVWASLPGSTSGQPQRTLLSLQSAFLGAGGVLA